MSDDAGIAGTECPDCGTPYRFGETGIQGDEGGPSSQAVSDRGVAYCPNPDCPGKSGQTDVSGITHGG